MKAIVIRDLNDNPLYIAKVEEISELDFLKIKKACKENQEEHAKSIDSAFAQLYKDIKANKQDIKVLKGEE